MRTYPFLIWTACPVEKKNKLLLNNKNNIYLVSTSLTQPAGILGKASVKVDYHRHVIFPCVYTHVKCRT